jgi:predicted aconitase with swiveling domain
VLAEQIRAGYAPAALLLAEPDGILVLGAIVAAELYGHRLPIVTLDLSGLPAGARVRAAPTRPLTKPEHQPSHST